MIYERQAVYEHTYKLSLFHCRVRIPSLNKRQQLSRIPLMVENKTEQNSDGGENVAVNTFKSQECFSGRPSFVTV